MPISGTFLRVWLIIQYIGWGLYLSMIIVAQIRDFCKCCQLGTNKEYLEKYERVKKLGFGGQANIWKVKLRNGKENEYFAAKEFKNEGFGGFKLVPAEASTIKKMDHPYLLHIEECFGISEDNNVIGHPVIVTDYVEGTRLREYIED